MPLIAIACNIIQLLHDVATLAQLAYARFGLSVNFKPGKTEATVRFRGPGSEIARRRALVTNNSVVSCASRIGSPFELRLVQKYKHLGGWNSTTCGFDADMSYRGAVMPKAVCSATESKLPHLAPT